MVIALVSKPIIRGSASDWDNVTIMQRIEHLTAVIEREGEGFVALCPELDIASQGDTVEQANSNLREALGLFFETAGPAEVEGAPSSRGLRNTPRSRGWVGYDGSPARTFAGFSRRTGSSRFGAAAAM